MSEKLKELTSKRGHIKASLTRLKTYCEKHATLGTIASLEERLSKHINLYEQFTAIQDEIDDEVNGTPLESQQAEERETFETQYFDVISSIRTYISESRSRTNSRTTPDSNRNTPVSSVAHTVETRLPVISLPNFDGSYGKWLTFRDTYESLIHTNESLTNIQKFHYLSSALKGEAARIIQSLGVSNSNYVTAWKNVKARYEDPKTLVYHHTKELVKLSPITKRSHITLRQFLDDFKNHVSALKTLKKEVDKCDCIVVFLMAEKLDPTTKHEWEKRVLSLTTEPTIDDLTKLIEDQCKYLERLSIEKPPAASKSVPLSSSRGNRPLEQTTSHLAMTQQMCAICKKAHALYFCPEFLKLSPNARLDEVKRLHLCFNCLRAGHSNKGCSRTTCKKCSRKHHTLLHLDTAASSQERAAPNLHDSEPSHSTNTNTQSYIAHSNMLNEKHGILSTAVVYLYDSRGNAHECRAMLDSGSQSHFLTEEFCRKLNLPRIKVDTSITGFGAILGNTVRHRVEVKLSSRYCNFHSVLSCLVTQHITSDIPNPPLNTASISIPPGMTLADPHFDKPGKIDMLIGVGIFWDLVCIGQHRLGPELPVLQKTKLGWIIAGEMDACLSKTRTNTKVHLVTNTELHNCLSKFWEIEQYGETTNGQKLNDKDVCEQHFTTTTTRNATNGRFIVSIPFTDRIHELGESREIAQKRLSSLERKLEKCPDLKRAYVSFMDEYIALGHMTEISNASAAEKINAYYLPHHPVVKEDSITTKVRVVFDGSAKTTSGLSLNDVQLVGPTVQNDLFSIILRFRKHKYAMSADIMKMYRQILVKPDERRFQRILWRTDSHLPIRTYQLNTVTYGTASAPFLATRALRQIGEEHAETAPHASQAIINDFYVDDLLTGANSISEAIVLRDTIVDLLGQAGLTLRKWATNNKETLTSDHSSTTDVHIHADENAKTLGILWKTDTDDLQYIVKLEAHKRITKRTILSEITKIFDPLGLIGPITVTAKIILQKLWEMQVSWDESLCQELHAKWEAFREELPLLSRIRVPRYIMCQRSVRIDMHGFCDASEKAYGACVYIRSTDMEGRSTAFLLTAKSRIAPIKKITLPRLELCGALLLSQLCSKVRDSLDLNFEHEYYWCDSTIVLAWIQGPSNRWKTFVANRSAEIERLSQGTWHHISTEENPADVISRGARVTQLISNQLWWHGPPWLSNSHDYWPKTVTNLPIDDLPETRQGQVTVMTAREQFSIFSRYSSYIKLKRVTAHCLRFLHNTRNSCSSTNLSSQKSRHIGPLSTQELLLAEHTLIKLAQAENFDTDLEDLAANRNVRRASALKSLDPFLDSKGLIRVGGRLEDASVPYDQKHPIILPAKHLLTELIIYHEHLRLMHAGCQLTIASLRTRYWPISYKSTVKKILRKCVKCFRAKPIGTEYVMGKLPADRVTPARPFYSCGVDYAGPFIIKDKKRSKVSIKAYLCVFVCFVTKAVHLELAVDLSTEAFLNCLRRFISRRGRCQIIHSDNGTNFVGAKNELKDLGALLSSKTHIDTVTNFTNTEGIQWEFIPPHAPHFGGLWEGAVKSAKYHLKRTLGNEVLTFEELYTILTQVEACLNSRPLSPISNDPNDLNPLTPSHFLIGDVITALPQPNFIDTKKNRLTRFQHITQLFQRFWQRWRQEYLSQLQQRHKWRISDQSKIAIGTLVVIKDDNLPPLKWKLGRIVDLHPGKDAVTRVVTLKLPDGTIKRPVSKICVLPINET